MAIIATPTIIAANVQTERGLAASATAEGSTGTVNVSSAAPASGSSYASSSGAVGSSAYPHIWYTTFTYYQVVYFQSQGESTTSVDSSTITKQTLLSVYASQSDEADSMFTSMEKSVQAHASATTLAGATSGTAAAGASSSSSMAASSSGAAGPSGLARHMFSRSDVPSACFLVLGGMVGLLAIAFVWHPLRVTEHRHGASTVLLHLPSGLPTLNEERDESICNHLRAGLDLPTVRINYRSGRSHQFPTPLHDVLAGYDWVLENLLPKRSISRHGRSESIGRVAVHGELFGGGLAIALALTECHLGQPGVVAAAVSHPIVDWLAFDEKQQTPKRASTNTYDSLAVAEASTSSFKDLRLLRAKIFAKPSHYFDPFASPMLFFRSAGTDAPAGHSGMAQDDLDYLSMSELDEAIFDETATDANGEEFFGTSDESIPPPARRRASRRFPGKKMGLRLPSFYIAATEDTPLASQAKELAHHLRASFVRQRKNAASRSFGFGRKVLVEGEYDQLTDDERTVIEAGMADARENVRLDLHEEHWPSDKRMDESKTIEMMRWLNVVRR
ncbi:uncharacterized protein LTR77_007748 [Saxophila tyrrhenica]|uniref:Alpha/beta hydrolase fold-3 domain-containing protein n=1 Tax=Saxophila tyrrhenica TaxID=1690608 RepID=A0AAV9P4Y0_9PEZI|nr:hypothetical protein LTR77_007748 [Saxophila tyrrhenica]